MPRRRAGGVAKEFVYRTAHLYEADLVSHELDKRGIAFHRAEEGPAGVRWAMPLSPAWEPGTTFLIVVPAAHAVRARRLVASLPVSYEDPGVWPSGMQEDSKTLWRWWAWVTLIGIAVGLLATVIDWFR